MKNKRNKIHGEQGIAMITTLIFLATLGVLATSLVFTVQNEMKTSSAYKYSRQAYYVAVAGVQDAVQWFVNSYQPHVPPTIYNITTLPVRMSGNDVRLAGFTGHASIYPNSTVAGDFTANFRNIPLIGNANNQGRYSVNATLLKHQPATFINPTTFINYPSAIERWRINSSGRWGAENNQLGRSEITAIIENSGNALFDRAIWGIDSIDLGGTMRIDSYDPRRGLWNESTNSGDLGSIGSNGTIEVGGNAVVRGDAAFGPSGSINVSSGATVTGRRIQLPSPRHFPPIPTFNVGTTNINVNSNSGRTINPGSYREIDVKGPLTLTPGVYYIDELKITGQGQLIISDNTTLFIRSSLEMMGQGLANTSLDPSKLTVNYSGTSEVNIAGGAQAYAEVYAPNAHMRLRGTSDFFGSFVGRTVTVFGTPKIHFSEGSLNNNLIQRQFRVINWVQDAF
ncbi:MAG TPA: pilus assembly PilX N-terminal domain-containing protein [Acidobacteriota bacterium]|nr:pilus assembly PilX N-terminal domain-containing protein [Acidobacteriota bacterium]